ncbi:hypothetical protein [Catenulispora rubra]|uniref:hypothetical protein n=1 Tax=Catenulispora rubra TaxID=280293 RepID=UPI0018928675|nr:hypothetical protein [Catenulispora rubra]
MSDQTPEPASNDGPAPPRYPECGGAGRAIDALYHRIRGVIEDEDGSWNGGDVVDAVAEMFHDLGYDLDAPYGPRRHRLTGDRRMRSHGPGRARRARGGN